MRIITGVLLAITFQTAQAADGRFSVINDQMLQGNRLVVQSENFSIETPNSDWQWQEFHRPPTISAYMVTNKNDKNEKYLISINKKNYDAVTMGQVKYYLEKIYLRHQKAGGKISNSKITRTDIPVKQSYIITYDGVNTDGKKFTTHTRFFANKMLYTISYSDNDGDRKKIADFEKFVESFKPLR
ncbi:MAG: hypothetical protein OEZ39_10530 [Gammaproteobacteria bacterium]|nr:hypothetical protein [Gammaproteobacteria bacterium]MDH5652278.1 hypothetical protein [Gammaproteobacteria bacterium]